ncbi:S9 family peptidase [soil metagenome]
MQATSVRWLGSSARSAALAAVAAVFLLMEAAVTPALAAPPSIEDFAKMPDIESVRVSPSGKRMALLSFGPDGNRRLGVIDLDPISKERVVAAFGDADVTSVRWVSDDRLVFEAFERRAEISAGGAATFAVNHDGSAQRQLIAWRYVTSGGTGSHITSRVLPYGWFLAGAIDDGSDEVFVYRRIRDSVGDWKQSQLSRLNTVTGEVRSVSLGMPDATYRWVYDAKNEVRVLGTNSGGRERILYRKPGSDKWEEVADFDPMTEFGFTPWFIDGDGQILVLARKGRDTEGLFRFDPTTRKLDPEPMVGVTGFDLIPTIQADTQTRRLLGMYFRADRPMSVWFDPAMQKIQKGVDAALPPDRSNRLYCGRCESTRFFVVQSTSDRQPGEYYLFDRNNASLKRIGAARPWIDEATQGQRTFHRITTRDGLKIPVYVTHPAGSKPDQPLPAVVLVHGGPWVRGASLTWEAESQFLASRGYRVIEPEFRGSEGYGFDLFRAGWKQWGRAMQDDLVDAVQWAAKQKLIDPDRVCIEGASYGGYAALMGPVSSPGVYRCAASYAGVTDIDLMYTANWIDTSVANRQYSMPLLIGDPVKDAAALAANSPLKRVADIKIPLLVGHGAADRRVPIEHSRSFVSAARAAGVQVEQVTYPQEAHGFVDPANQVDYWRRLENLLDKSLKTPR